MIAQVKANLAVLILIASQTLAQDRSKLGDFYSNIPLYRTGQGSNVVSVGVGTPEQRFNLTFCEYLCMNSLTIATNVEHIMVVTTQCEGCVEGSQAFDVDETESLTVSDPQVTFD